MAVTRHGMKPQLSHRTARGRPSICAIAPQVPQSLDFCRARSGELPHPRLRAWSLRLERTCFGAVGVHQVERDEAHTTDDLAKPHDWTTNPMADKYIYPGVYHFTSSGQLTGIMHLDAQGDSSAMFVFQVRGRTSVALRPSLFRGWGPRDTESLFLSASWHIVFVYQNCTESTMEREVSLYALVCRIHC